MAENVNFNMAAAAILDFVGCHFAGKARFGASFSVPDANPCKNVV